MDGIGEKLVDQLLHLELIQTIPDLYRLQQAELENIERMGEKSALNVLKELAKTKTLNLGRFLHAMGLSGIGPELATTVAQKFTSLEAIMQWANQAIAEPGSPDFGPEVDEKGKPDVENQAIRALCEVDGIGLKVAVLVRDGLLQRGLMIEDLSSLITVLDEPQAEQGGPLAGKTFCLTGSLQRPRKEVQQTIKAAGGKVVGSVSSQLDVLVAGEKSGSKLAKAQRLGVTVWNEEQLINACTADGEPVAVPKEESSPKTSQQASLSDFD
jgi:DNA ligase (NAD+)